MYLDYLMYTWRDRFCINATIVTDSGPKAAFSGASVVHRHRCYSEIYSVARDRSISSRFSFSACYVGHLA